MSSVTTSRSTQLDWYDEVCQKLDLLKLESIQCADEEDVLPSDALYARVKQYIQDLHRLTDFHLPIPGDIWLGPDGLIGLTWNAADRKLDIIFSESWSTARLTAGAVQQSFEQRLIPIEVMKFAA